MSRRIKRASCASGNLRVRYVGLVDGPADRIIARLAGRFLYGYCGCNQGRIHQGPGKDRTLEIGAELHLGPAPANRPHRSVPAHAFGAARQLARDHGLGREVAGRGSAARGPRCRRRRDGGGRGISRLSRAEALRLVARADRRERRRRRGASGAADFERAHDPRLSGAPLGMGSPRRDGCRRGGRRDAAGLGGVGTAPALLRGPVRFGPAGRTLAGARRRGAPAPPPGGRVRLRAGLRRVVRGRLLRRGRQSRRSPRSWCRKASRSARASRRRC